MKKIIAMLLTLCLLLGLGSAVAEQGFDSQFIQNLQEMATPFLRGEQMAKLTISNPNDGALLANISLSQDSRAQLVNLRVQTADQDVLAQFGQDAVWFSAAGQVYELRYEDILSFLQQMIPQTSARSMDSRQVERLSQLAMEDIVKPGLTAYRRATGEQTIHFSYTQETLTAGFLAFGDHVTADEQLTQTMADLLRQMNPTMQLRPADLRMYWAMMRGEMQNSEGDFSLEGDLRSNEDQITFEADLRSNGGHAKLSGSLENLGETNAIRFHAQDPVHDQEVLDLELITSKTTSDMSGSLKLPSQNESYSWKLVQSENVYDFSLEDNKGTTCLAKLEKLENGISFTGSVNNGTSSKCLEAALTEKNRGNYLLKISAYELNNNQRYDGFSLTGTWDRMTRAFSLYVSAGDFLGQLDGLLYYNGFNADLTVNSGRYFRLSGHAEASRSQLNEISAAFNARMMDSGYRRGFQDYSGELFLGRSRSNFSLLLPQMSLKANYRTDRDGQPVIHFSRTGDLYSDVDITYNAGELLVDTYSTNTSITGAFTSEREYVLTVRNRPKSSYSKETQYGYVKFGLSEITENGSSVSMTIQDIDGGLKKLAELAFLPLNGQVAPLSGMNPIRITPEMIMNSLQGIQNGTGY
ncbi:MAG: hypothetical protein IKH38_05330 [Clostridia bacterium]|nr:hypothetical protein [Clostridia bacterium]